MLVGLGTWCLVSLANCGANRPDGAKNDAVTVTSPVVVIGVKVLTNKNDIARTGANTAETILTPQNVNATQFGRAYARTVNGNILTQPLYVGGLNVGGVVYNTVFTATSENDVYAFDADNTFPGGSTGLLWHANVGATAALWDDACNESPWSHGIVSTPVIDDVNGVMFVVARKVFPCTGSRRCDSAGIPGAPPFPACNGGCSTSGYFLNKINLANGAILSSTEISGTANGVPFDPLLHQSRPGLLLMNGFVYMAFASRACDGYPHQELPFYGWVFGYRASDLAQVAVYNDAQASGTKSWAGVWQSGNGLAGDGANVYLFTGNGQAGNTLGNSVLQLAVAANGSLSLAHFFTPSNASILDQGDTDLGAGGPVLLPGGRLIGGGKEGRFYLLNRSTLAAVAPFSQGFQAARYAYHPDTSSLPACYTDPPPPFIDAMYPGSDGLINTMSFGLQPNCSIRQRDYQWSEKSSPNIHGGPAFFQVSSSTGYLYLSAEKDYLKAFQYGVVNGVMVCGAGSPTGECNPVATSQTVLAPDGMPGGQVSVSSNNTTNGIVWDLMVSIDGQLLLRDGTSLSTTYGRLGQDYGKKIYGRLIASNALTLQELWRDPADVPYTKFMPPTVADGWVFRPTVSAGDMVQNPQSELITYGLNGRNDWRALTSVITSVTL